MLTSAAIFSAAAEAERYCLACAGSSRGKGEERAALPADMLASVGEKIDLSAHPCAHPTIGTDHCCCALALDVRECAVEETSQTADIVKQLSRQQTRTVDGCCWWMMEGGSEVSWLLLVCISQLNSSIAAVQHAMGSPVCPMLARPPYYDNLRSHARLTVPNTLTTHHHYPPIRTTYSLHYR